MRSVVDVPDIVVHDVGTNAAGGHNVVVNPSTGTFQLFHYRPICANV